MKDNAYSAPDTEFRELDTLYRQGARELPPAHLDAQILEFASARGEQSATAPRQKSPRRFPYVMSTAASVLLLVGLFIINPELVNLDLEPRSQGYGEPASQAAPAAFSESMSGAMPESMSKSMSEPVSASEIIAPETTATAADAGAASAPRQAITRMAPQSIPAPAQEALNTTSGAASAPAAGAATKESVASANVAAAAEEPVTTDGIETELQALEAALIHSGELHDNRAQFKALLEQFEAKDYPLTDGQLVRLKLLRQFAH
ncbi:hypothetical protein KJI95_02230 [Shewanella sp. JM162201]|uniref:Uncharacterized protein n=1 Tax=Shewanella jiangmenensis TaxID=2837387 RepID=A0ABS5UYX0_9GAMM|nr:hypothetical protein [Shewanella jiangmenensis]MBT1443347.1 hypothetical protein [Shewanella jiangmenensis]